MKLEYPKSATFFRNSGKLIYISVNHPPEAQQIKSIHLCSIPQPDILIWPEVNSGDYSIKTDYKALQEKPTLAADEIEASEAGKKKSFGKAFGNTFYGNRIQTLYPLERIC